MKLSILVACVLLKVSTGSEPQVYEDIDDQIQEESKRVVRQPLVQPRANLYKPPVFRFEGATQQDPRKFQYAQQQKVDMQNILRRAKMVDGGPLRVSLVQDWKVEDPVVSSSTPEQHYQLPEKSNDETVVTLSTKKPVTSRKLKPSSYYEDLGGDKIKRQDNNHVVYINPELVKSGTDYDLNALSALVGQHPNNQLQGLKRLLETPQPGLVLSPIKTPLPHPITENVEDIPNPNTHPNVDTSVTLDSLQVQLDEAAKAQFAKALADAQQQAQAHVEAQHQAIAKAQEEAQKKALAEIALHNRGIKTLRLPQSQRGFRPIHEPLQQPLALALKQEPVYAPGHSHHQQDEEVVKAHVQDHESPSAYQQVVLETQGHKVYPGGEDDGEHHQYAARYAFGYKIRDVKMGNEFGHEEKRDGENAKGLYHVLLPDGRLQKVEYYADPSGYHAKVTYENLAHH